jgi:diguanylate cyclase
VVVYGSVLLRSVFVNSVSFARRVMRQIEAERSVRQDPLTHLPNRVAFNETLDAALKRLTLSGEEFAVLLLDLDRFKEVNDKFGHPAGDEFLVQIASRLQRCTRAAGGCARDRRALRRGLRRTVPDRGPPDRRRDQRRHCAGAARRQHAARHHEER